METAFFIFNPLPSMMPLFVHSWHLLYDIRGKKLHHDIIRNLLLINCIFAKNQQFGTKQPKGIPRIFL